MDQKWNKYSYVCSNCDTLIEYTTTHQDLETYCVCAESDLHLLSVVDATINSNNNQKEVPPMLATTEYLEEMIAALQEHIQKKDAQIERLQDEVSQKSRLAHAHKVEQENFRNSVKEYVIEVLNERQITHEVAEALASICDFELTKTLTITATVDFEVEVEVPFDMDGDEVAESLDFSVDSYSYSIDDFQVDVQSLQSSDNIS